MFKVREAQPLDAQRGLVRVHPHVMLQLGIREGEVVEIHGRKTTAAVVHEGDPKEDPDVIRIDGLTRENAAASIDDAVTLQAAVPSPARSVTLQPLSLAELTDRERDSAYLLSLLDGRPVRTGDRLRLNLFGTHNCDFEVTQTTPDGTTLINPGTYINLLRPQFTLQTNRVSYEDIGGLGNQIRKVREMIELPLRFPQIFIKLGIQPPKGVLLYGPPGTGKTVIARAVANETDAWFTHISGPEIIGKYYGESEERLRAIFEEAQSRAPAIIFIDEIDAIAPKREDMGGEKQVERRVVAQLLALLDGLESRGQIVVIGATNIPNSLDPALRRPGRFDREIAVPIPNSQGRLEILQIHTRGMPLSPDVDLTKIAELSHGFVGADLEALAKEAAMACVRDLIPNIDLRTQEVPYEKVSSMKVSMEHFMSALLEIEPSAVREVFVEVPNVFWEDIGGLEEIKEKLIQAVEWPIRYSDFFARYSIQPAKGILLYGPSGTGKTLLVKALARQSGVNFIPVKGPSLMSRYVGESERALREVFRVARQAAPSILYFDEIESLFPARKPQEAGSSFTERVTGQFLSEMSGMEGLKGVVVLASTNRIDLLDPELLTAGRFDLVLRLPLPDERAREAIFDIELRKKPLSPDISLKELSRKTEGASGAEIAFICRSAAFQALKTHLTQKTPEFRLEQAHFAAALDELSRRRRCLDKP